MHKLYIFGLIALTVTIIGLAFADQVTFTTYYPAPYGVYREFTTTSKTCLATNPLGTDGSEDPNAMVGIGTTEPNAVLEINQDNDPLLRLQSASQSASMQMYNDQRRWAMYVHATTGEFKIADDDHPSVPWADAFHSVPFVIEPDVPTDTLYLGTHDYAPFGPLRGNVYIGTDDPTGITKYNGSSIPRTLEVACDIASTIGLINSDTGEKMTLLWDSQQLPVTPRRLAFFYDTHPEPGKRGSTPFIFNLETGEATATKCWTSLNAWDYAEMFTAQQSLQPGDVVSIDERYPGGIKKSDSAYDKRGIGIISEDPAFLAKGGLEEDLEEGINAFPVALSGQVYTKVSLENGPVELGDYLTTSSIAGHAMKATSPGTVIGKALEAFNSGPNGEETGKILVFVNTGYYGGGAEEKIAQLEAKVEKLEALLEKRELVKR